MYTTIAKVKARLGTYEAMITGEMQDTEINGFISETDKMIDGYIAAAVRLPFANTPDLISAISTHITVRNLWAQTQARSVPDHVRYDYENSIKLLEQIARGSLKLSADDPASDTFNDLKYSAAKRVFRPAL